jgi:hypothetical protein
MLDMMYRNPSATTWRDQDTAAVVRGEDKPAPPKDPEGGGM